MRGEGVEGTDRHASPEPSNEALSSEEVRALTDALQGVPVAQQAVLHALLEQSSASSQLSGSMRALLLPPAGGEALRLARVLQELDAASESVAALEAAASSSGLTHGEVAALARALRDATLSQATSSSRVSSE